MRGLPPEEQALWARVTETIRPLSRVPPPKAPNITPKIAPPVRPAPPPITPKLKGPAPKAPTRSVGLRPVIDNTLDSSWDRRIRSGDIRPDRIVDLHGQDLDRAWQSIDRALEQAIVNRERVILLVTGHARAGDPPVRRGRIRAAVHDWLAASRHRDKIAAVRGAHRRHGGGGSLYLILRR